MCVDIYIKASLIALFIAQLNFSKSFILSVHVSKHLNMLYIYMHTHIVANAKI